MTIPNLPSEQQIRGETRPLTNALYEYFDEAAKVCLPHFTKRQPPVPVDNNVMTVMVRGEVRRLLNAHGIPAEEDQEDLTQGSMLELSLERVALVGLVGRFNGYHFRLLKSLDGSLPLPSSDRRRAEYGQQLSLLGFDGDPESLRPNIEVLWRPDQNWTMFELTLSVPKAAGRFKASLLEYYHIQIPYPEAAIKEQKPSLLPSPPAIEPEITLKVPTSATEGRE